MGDGDRGDARQMTDTAGQQSREVAESAKAEASQVKDAARDQAREVKDEVAAQARGLVDQAKTELRDQSEVQAHQVAQERFAAWATKRKRSPRAARRMLVRSRTTYARREAKPGR